MSETKRVNRFHALATAAYMRELADHGALTPEESIWLMGARDVIEALVGERDAASRATPQDGPVVTVTRDTSLTCDLFLWMGQPVKDEHGDWDVGPEVPHYLTDDMAKHMGVSLAPGACQRFRLVPEGET